MNEKMYNKKKENSPCEVSGLGSRHVSSRSRSSRFPAGRLAEGERVSTCSPGTLFPLFPLLSYFPGLIFVVHTTLLLRRGVRLQNATFAAATFFLRFCFF